MSAASNPLLALAFGTWLAVGPVAADEALPVEDIELLAGYIIDAVGADGRLVYLRSADGSRVDGERYNLLRHAGALYALAEFLADSAGDKGRDTVQGDGRAALRRGIDYLLAQVDVLPAVTGALALWSDASVNGGNAPRQAKLGGAGLALLALASAERVLPGVADAGVLRGLASFVLYMQKADGSFHSKYVPSEGGRRDQWVSLYYPGEAAIGLLAAYELDPRTAWLEGAARALAYLARSRAGADVVPADHWAMIATGRLLRLQSQAPGLVDRATLMTHLEQLARAILAEQASSARRGEPHFGAFTADARSTPTATRLEGLQAAMEVLPDNLMVLRAVIDCGLRDGIAFLRRGVLRSGSRAGGVTRRVPDSGVAGGDRRAGEIRIDYVQHTLSVMLGERRHPAGRECR